MKKPFLYKLPYYPIAGHRRKRVCLNQTKESNHFMQVAECREQAAGRPLAWELELVENGWLRGEIFKQRQHNQAKFRVDQDENP